MQFIEQSSKRNHPTIKFTAEISETETFLDTNIYKGERFRSNSVLDVRHTSNLLKHFNIRTSLRATPGVKKGFIKGEALRLLRTNSSKNIFEE